MVQRYNPIVTVAVVLYEDISSAWFAWLLVSKSGGYSSRAASFPWYAYELKSLLFPQTVVGINSEDAVLYKDILSVKLSGTGFDVMVQGMIQAVLLLLGYQASSPPCLCEYPSRVLPQVLVATKWVVR